MRDAKYPPISTRKHEKMNSTRWDTISLSPPGPIIIVVGHRATVVYCRDTVISCYWRSRRALVTGTLFQVPSSFSVFLQIKLERAGWRRGVFWILSVDLYEMILTRNTYSPNLEGPPLTYRSLCSVCAPPAFLCVEFPVPHSLPATSWLFLLSDSC